MYKKYEIEFGKMYKRLMALEIIIKEKATFSIISVYGDECLDKFSNFFNNKSVLKHYSDNYDNKITSILRQNLSEKEKFKKVFNLLYLNHVLKLTLTYKQFCNEDIARLFYFKKPENFKSLKDSKNHIRDLRNDIAHYNFNRYEQNKQLYLKALMLFEIHIGCSIATLYELPEFDKKPTIKDILIRINQLHPALFKAQPEEQEYHYNKDRILLDLFDDFAVVNGWDYSELPSPWSILRQKYDVTN